MDGQIFRKEQQQYAEWLCQQPPAVEWRTYDRPAGILRRDHDVKDNEINASDGRADLSIGVNEDEAAPAELRRVHHVNNVIPNDTTNSRRHLANATPIDSLYGATCTEGVGESTYLCNAAQLDESCADDGNVVAGPVSADQLDKSQDTGDTDIDGVGSEYDYLDHRFLCALKAVDTTNTDDPPQTHLQRQQISSMSLAA
jgi:hypothetical protein